MGVEELDRLIALHTPQPAPEDSASLETVEKTLDLGDLAQDVRFVIPGFAEFGCGECHEAEALLTRSAERMHGVLEDLQSAFPAIKPVPLKQYLIQPWADEFLHPRQFAHTTFDTIRIFPRTILIDDAVYGNATQLHESLHLTQPFIGHANELEAYGLNIRSDPKFLLLNFPYFADVVTAFFIPEFHDILKAFYAQPVRERLRVSREVQWFLLPFEETHLAALAQAVKDMQPVLEEMSRLMRAHPVAASYLSEQTGNPALLLEIAAARLLPLPPADMNESLRKKAWALFDTQIRKTDNTRLGYKIDRKKEALLTLKFQHGVVGPEGLHLYFHFLRDRFVKPDGEVELVVEDEEDFAAFTQAQLKKIRTLGASKRLTPVERKAADVLIETIENELAAAPTGAP